MPKFVDLFLSPSGSATWETIGSAIAQIVVFLSAVKPGHSGVGPRQPTQMNPIMHGASLNQWATA